MTIEISVYDSTQFLTSGKLKKKARAEFGMLLGDVDEIKESDKDRFLKASADRIKREYHSFTIPYVFTKIIAQRKSDNAIVYIYEDVTINGNKFYTTPKKLLEYINTN